MSDAKPTTTTHTTHSSSSTVFEVTGWQLFTAFGAIGLGLGSGLAIGWNTYTHLVELIFKE
jgi:hypothetical protein